MKFLWKRVDSPNFTLSLYNEAAFVLYFVLIGRLDSSLSSKKLFIFRFPPTFIFSNSDSFHLSIVTLLTKLRCTPNPRCFPEHSKHIHIPYVALAHCGLCAPHSKHRSLSSFVRSSASTLLVLGDVITLD